MNKFLDRSKQQEETTDKENRKKLRILKAISMLRNSEDFSGKEDLMTLLESLDDSNA